MRGAEQSAVDYLDLLAQRKMLIEDATRRLAPYDALVMPTVAILPPALKEIADDASYSRFNLLSLRNCTLINMIDGCAISLPIASSNGAPVGLMLAGLPGQDHALFSIAGAVERIVSA
jgi:aspartyl-tRNA(Asn)/glutamyl-tRNA(Gln) amidotransferase subunit A